jgi:hypothetical protein
MKLRFFFVAFAFVASIFFTSSARAGSYLDRAALLLDGTRKECDLLQPRMADKELVRIVSAMAAARVDVAEKMEVPAAVGKAHPHLLLVLTNADAALRAARDGDFKKFMEHLTAARNEDRSFRAVLKELGYVVRDLTTKG